MLSALIVVLLLSSCSEEVTVTLPEIDPEGDVAGMAGLTDETMDAMEGVYAVVEGQQLLGEEVVLKHAGAGLSLFTGKDALHALFVHGWSDSTVHLAGYWRKLVTLDVGTFRLAIDRSEGAVELLHGRRPGQGRVEIRGSYGNGSERGQREVLLRYVRPLFTSATPFYILAHRAGGRNADRLPASENSAELVRLAERYGANGVEIDVQLTKDGVPVIYHDEQLNLRLTQKSGLVGALSDYTLAQLETFIRLKNGERIPTLKRMLATILRQTQLRFVWLDSKSSVPISMLRDLQRAYADSATLFQRDLRIVIGLPDEDKVEELLTLPDFADADVLCELDIERVRATHAEFWAPRWTLGTQPALVSAMKEEGRGVFTWTLDEARYIQEFLQVGLYDGILTNYPTLVAFYYYSQ